MEALSDNILSTVWAVPKIFSGTAFILCKSGTENVMKKVGILMGSDSDLPVVEKAMDTLKDLGVPFEVHVYSAHRTPKEV